MQKSLETWSVGQMGGNLKLCQSLGKGGLMTKDQTWWHFEHRSPIKTHNCTWSIGCTCSLRARSLLYMGPNLFRPPLIRSCRTAEEKEKLASWTFHHHKKTLQSTASSFQNRSHYWIEIEGIWYLGQWSSFVINSVNSLPINIPSEMCTSQYFPSLIQLVFLLTWCLSTDGPWQGILKI